jgi:hypothetical protein
LSFLPCWQYSKIFIFGQIKIPKVFFLRLEKNQKYDIVIAIINGEKV